MTDRLPKARHALYILTDASGFTTCCEASREALFREAERRPLLAPITIVHWMRMGAAVRADMSLTLGWKKASEWLWNGGLTVGT